MKYKIVGKFHLGNVGDVIELNEREGAAWVEIGRLQPVKTESKAEPKKTTRKPRAKKSGKSE